MLFWICIIFLVVGIVWLVLDDCSDWFEVQFTITGIGLIGLIISIIAFCSNYINVDGYIDQMNVRHDSLVYQYENDIYENDNDVGKRELMTDIQNWNEDLARLREAQYDFWVGIYRPNIYDQFEFIELERQEVEQND